MVHLKTNFHDREVTIRDLEESDVETLVSYWHDSDPAYLSALGVNLEKLTSREQTRSRFLSSLAGSQRNPERATFIVSAAGQPVAYTNLNFRSMDEVYVHVHTLERSPLARALVYFLFPKMVEIFFNCFPITQLTMQTARDNKNINRFLGKFGLVPKSAYISSPDGMARPGQFHIYEIPRAAAAQVSRKLHTVKTHGE